MNEITLTYTGEDFRLERLNQLVGYLTATMSPVDLSIIVELNDHKGDLTVTFDAKKLQIARSFFTGTVTAGDYDKYLQTKIKAAWEIQHEYNVEFTTRKPETV